MQIGKNERRIIWAATRSVLETDTYKRQKKGKSRRYWKFFKGLLKIFIFIIKVVKLYEIGLKNAKNIVINEKDFYFENLPAAFDGYKIMHLSDLHFDTLEGIENIIAKLIKSQSCDICVITGDYRKKNTGGVARISEPIQTIVNALQQKDGIYSVFGNHDSYLMLNPLEKAGINVLPNESLAIKKGNEQIVITGIDDPHSYYTDQIVDTIEESNGEFKILLAHSPEMFREAEKNGYSLYFCGHTHAGQICLPGGIPLITHLYDGKKFYKGKWQYKKLSGYTSSGCGVSGIPIRFNCIGEVAILTLKKK
ncbi:MAG: metallophosphoesterase [Bacteroidetes bacterium]|jgi:uncharacterized protein|nr:metallophosphoesterase [Bacteroidota bacterium]MBT6686595.1 metallophosphoesterase [Bacteroidota bacterium]MBT7141919.1 metallophosphoesterase [Bacteroidota bacterium]MBT7490662.1 metallophosphoesterase [Bacteroidota bacterium]